MQTVVSYFGVEFRAGVGSAGLAAGLEFLPSVCFFLFLGGAKAGGISSAAGATTCSGAHACMILLLWVVVIRVNHWSSKDWQIFLLSSVAARTTLD